MSETIRGIYRNGVIEPVEPLKIAEGTEVYVTVQRRFLCLAPAFSERRSNPGSLFRSA